MIFSLVREELMVDFSLNREELMVDFFSGQGGTDGCRGCRCHSWGLPPQLSSGDFLLLQI